jgi:TetR/AcrR family transcriptional regulator, transcriptional repressor for nem operon
LDSKTGRREIATQFASFRDWVADSQESDKPKRKGERTRDRIKLATIDLLNETGYRDLKIADICEAAGITPPVLYLYYDSKLALAEEILSEFLGHFMNRPSTKSRDIDNPYDAIFLANLDWMRLARVNGGLLRCLFQYSDEAPEFAKLFSASSQRWYSRVTRSIIRRFPDAAIGKDEILLTVHALGGMIDDLARRLYADREHELREIVGTVAPDDEALAHFLSRIWMRALYRSDPVATGGLAIIGHQS